MARDGETRHSVGVLQRFVDMVRYWGSSEQERLDKLPCDDLFPRPDLILFRAVDVEAPAPAVFRWLCQLRVAPYSYDWIDNYGRRSPQHLTPGLEDLEVGQQFMTIFRLSGLVPGSSLTLTTDNLVLGRVAITYRVTPTDSDRTRLLAKLVVSLPPGIRRKLMKSMLPAGDLLMMRRQLLNLKQLAERGAGTWGNPTYP